MRLVQDAIILKPLQQAVENLERLGDLAVSIHEN
jgi:hypothetical protein